MANSNRFKVSQSKVKTYRRCREAYWLKYVEKLRAKKKSRALTFGSLVHQMLEADLEGDDPMEVLDSINVSKMKLFAAEKAEYAQIIEDVRLVMREYFPYWEEHGNLTPVRIKGRSSEHQFEIEIRPGIFFVGKIDAVARGNGLRWMVEHKTFKRRPSDDDRWRNLQSVSYFRAMDILGWPSVDGTCWDYIWSSPPRIPSLLKDGSMSQKSIDTMPLTVIDAIKASGFELLDYKKFIDSTYANRSKWFFRVFTPVNAEVRDHVFKEFVDTATEIADNHGKQRGMNIERHCSWCEFEPLCRAKLQGLDYDFVKERQYETNTHEDSEAAHTYELED